MHAQWLIRCIDGGTFLSLKLKSLLALTLAVIHGMLYRPTQSFHRYVSPVFPLALLSHLPLTLDATFALFLECIPCCLTCYSTDEHLSFSSTHDPAYNPQTSLLEGTAWSDTRSCQQTVHFSFHCLVTILLLGQNMRSRSAELYLWHFPFVLLWLPFLDRVQDIDCKSTSPMFPLSADNHF